MQYRLSTIFLVFFVVATSLAVFGAWGIWIAAVLAVAALCFNKAKTTASGAIWAFCVIVIGIICPEVLLPASGSAREAPRRVTCANNMKQIGLGLHNYHDAHKHFPPVIIRDKDGKPLYSWLVPILPHMEYDTIYNQLKADEPWNSLHNGQVLGQLRIDEMVCPGAQENVRINSTNYLAIVGPGTFWRSDKALCLSDLQGKSSTTVAAVECMKSNKHWTEPCILTVDEFLEQMEDGKKLKTSPAHPHEVHVLFANSAVRGLSAEMPIAMWRKLLMGEVKSVDELDDWKPNPYAPLPANLFAKYTPDEPGKWPFLLSIFMWLISLVMLFRRAWKSREMPAKP